MRVAGIILLAIGVTLFVNVNAKADWVDTWMTNVTSNYTGPHYLEGQKRDYGSFGTFSTRQLMTTDHLATFTPPRVRFGCGGIDIFSGGFSYMNFDYLVQKFQNIISAAPAFAFEYALRSISSQTGSIVDSLESMSNLLNQIQLDDCKASKALGVYLVDQARGNPDALGKAVAKFKQDTGVDDLWKHVQDDFFSRTNPGETTAQENLDVNHDCPRALKDLVNSTSLLSFICGQYFAGYDNSFEELLRGYLGDVTFEWNNNHLYVHSLPWCGGENKDSFKVFVEGRAKVNPSPTDLSACVDFSGTSIRQLVETSIEAAYQNMQTDAPLTAAQEAVIQLIPLPIYEHLRQCYIYSAPDSVVSMLYDPAAYGLGYALLTSVYTEVVKTIDLIKETRIKACEAQMGGDKHCFICEQDDSLEKALDKYKENVYRREKEAVQAWNDVQTELQKSAEVLKILKELSNDAVRTRLASGRRD